MWQIKAKMRPNARTMRIGAVWLTFKVVVKSVFAVLLIPFPLARKTVSYLKNILCSIA